MPYHVGEIFDDIDDSQQLMQIVDDHAPVKTKIIKGKDDLKWPEMRPEVIL